MHVYVLECEDKQFFIGASSKIDKIQPIFKLKPTGTWIKDKHIVEVVDVIQCPEGITYQKFKNYTVARYMKEYGIDNVRGGSWTGDEIPAHGRKLLTSVFPLIHFESTETEIEEIYERELRRINTESSERFFRETRYVEERSNLILTLHVKRYVECPLCRGKTEKQQRILKGIVNECSICLHRKCQIVCDQCCVPNCCEECYSNLKPFS